MYHFVFYLDCFRIFSRFIDEIERTKEKSEAILQGIGDAVFVVNKNLIIEQFNKAAVELSGVNEQSAMGKHYKDVLRFVFESNGKPNDDFIKEAIKSGKPQTLKNHTILVRKDGRRIPVADSVAPLFDRDGDVESVVVVFRDVSEEREVDRLKTEFVSLASHQLRTPLTGIKWATELILNEQKGLTPKQINYIQRIHESEEHMVELVNGLLNVTRLEAGTLMIQPKLLDVGVFIASLGKDFLLVFEKEKINFKIQIPPTPIVLPIDKEVLGIVIHNLIANALKYTPKNGNVRLSLEKKASEISIRVSDTGIGIPIKQQSRIFEKFFRADNAVIKAIGGTGLGLYVTKIMVEQAGGKISFVSQVEKGSTFIVTFPLSGMRVKEGEKKPVLL